MVLLQKYLTRQKISLRSKNFSTSAEALTSASLTSLTYFGAFTAIGIGALGLTGYFLYNYLKKGSSGDNGPVGLEKPTSPEVPLVPSNEVPLAPSVEIPLPSTEVVVLTPSAEVPLSLDKIINPEGFLEIFLTVSDVVQVADTVIPLLTTAAAVLAINQLVPYNTNVIVTSQLQGTLYKNLSTYHYILEVCNKILQARFELDPKACYTPNYTFLTDYNTMSRHFNNIMKFIHFSLQVGQNLDNNILRIIIGGETIKIDGQNYSRAVLIVPATYLVKFNSYYYIKHVFHDPIHAPPKLIDFPWDL